MTSMMDPGDQPGVRSFLPCSPREFGLSAKRQGSVARPTYNTDPPLSLGVDHGWCVYSKLCKPLLTSLPLLRDSRNGILSVRTQKSM